MGKVNCLACRWRGISALCHCLIFPFAVGFSLLFTPWIWRSCSKRRGKTFEKKRMMIVKQWDYLFALLLNIIMPSCQIYTISYSFYSSIEYDKNGNSPWLVIMPYHSFPQRREGGWSRKVGGLLQLFSVSGLDRYFIQDANKWNCIAF